MPADEHRTPASEEQVRAATRPVMWFSVVLLIALWLSVSRQPWPLPLFPGVLALVGLVLGIVGLVRMHRARIGGATRVLVVLGLGLAAAMVLLAGVQAVMWPVYAELHACMDRALTVQAEGTCLTSFEGSVQGWLRDLIS